MKKGYTKTLLMLVALCILGTTSTMARPQAKRMVIIALDGISVPGFTTANTPHLDKLLNEGALSLTTRVVMPSVTLPNWTSHLTGSGPEQHGVVDNSWEIDKKHLSAMATDEDGYYPSVFQVLKEKMPTCKTAFYYNSYISVHTDHVGHASRWMSPEYIRSIEEADVEIGKFIDKMKAEGLYEKTHFLFLSDHGGTGYGHGGMSEDEMIVPWGITGPGIRQQFKLEEPNNTVNTAVTILHLFKIKKPLSWTGEVPFSIFK